MKRFSGDHQQIFSKKRKLVCRNNDLVTSLSGNNELMKITTRYSHLVMSLSRYYDIPTFVSLRKFAGDHQKIFSFMSLMGPHKGGATYLRRCLGVDTFNCFNSFVVFQLNDTKSFIRMWLCPFLLKKHNEPTDNKPVND